MAVPDTTSDAFTCLLVDDDKAFASMAAKVVRESGGEPVSVHTLAAAREITAARGFDVVLLDNHLPDGLGYEFFSQIARRYPAAPIIMITGIPDLSEAVTLTRNGLFDYVTKPVSVDALAACLGRAKLRLASREQPVAETELLGDSAVMREVLTQLRQAARHVGGTVLLTGETGSGKDMAARALHQLGSSSATAPFIAVNCATLPADMFEAELFGAEKGAYTGADKKRIGLAAAAAGGTLFLDEIAEVPLVLQAKLLRLLEEREFRPLGMNDTLKFTGRFVAATNRNLADEVKAGRFREDLLYRLDVFAVELPPLRARRADIPLLAERLLRQLAEKYGRAKPSLKPDDLSVLGEYNFPGNVRELRNVIERSLLRTEENAKWLVLDLNWLKRGTAGAGSGGLGLGSGAVVAPTQTVDRELSPIEAQEYQLIKAALAEARGGIRRAATKLGLSPQALLRRLEKWPELRVEKE